MQIPVYLRAQTFYIHTRVNGKQVKRSLKTSNKTLAIIRACQFLQAQCMSNDEFDFSKIRKFEVDLSRGIMKSDGPEDYQRMMEALRLLTQLSPKQSFESPVSIPQTPAIGGLKLNELLDKFFLLKQTLSIATINDYRKVVEDFKAHSGNPNITDVSRATITRWQESLAAKNSSRTIDKKIGVICTLFNYAIKQSYFFQSNPAEGRKLLTKRQKQKGGWAIIKEDEADLICKSDYMKVAKEKDPDYYYCVVIAFLTGCRVGEITNLQKTDLKISKKGICYIDVTDAKTVAGIREVPIPKLVFENLKSFAANFSNRKTLFKYVNKEGQGSGNAAGKKFSRHLHELKIEREKLVFHSIRKFVNDYMMKSGLALEPRCQLIGHELDNVNVATYSQQFSIDDLAALVIPVQQKIWEDFF
jgi:integrase